MIRKIKMLFVLISAIFIGGVFTRAYFSDSVAITNNTFTTGTWAVSPSGPSAGDVVINELMWMGSTASSDDEWIELRNMTSLPIDISGWEISKLVTSEVLMLKIPEGSEIPAGGYYLISKFSKENTNSALNVSPNLVSGGVGLRNSNMQIKLYSGPIGISTLIDIADDGSGAPLMGTDGGIPGPRQSMARNAEPGDGTLANNWFTDTINNSTTYWDSEDGNYGTPGGPNV